MNNSHTLIFICLVALISLVKADIECHYCGLKQLCPLPYDEKSMVNVVKVRCEKTCMKFDGYAEDGKRVIVRDCDRENDVDNLNACLNDKEYFGSKGTMCVCNAADCNGAEESPNLTKNLAFSLISVVAVTILNLLLF